MYEFLANLLLNNGAQLVHTTSRAIGESLKRVSPGEQTLHCEVSLNEKIAFELCLAGSYASKRTACILGTEGLYEALDPLMSSAYTGCIGGFLIVCIKETDQDVTPLGLFSKLPLIVSETADDLVRSVEFGYTVSERYEIPVIIQTTPEADRPSMAEARNEESARGKAEFIKNPGRWAATPAFRYQLHRALNEKIEKIRQEFETYEGNKVVISGTSGLITDRQEAVEYYGEDLSLLHLSTLHPLPTGLVNSFISRMDRVFLVEGPQPVIELQIEDRAKVRVERIGTGQSRRKPDETMFGYRVVRDTLGPGSSINMAHGWKKLEPQVKLLAITFEDYFFNSGMAAMVNTLYNDSAFAILVLTNNREKDMMEILDGFGFHNYCHIDALNELERFKDRNELTVAFWKGIV
jgi:TPP-dependent indolepyruvate ferredoxin oxidoreductase alpha subunit